MELVKRETERRNKHRFAIQREIRYRIAEDGVVVTAGSGQTINIGSGGVAFSADGPLPRGALIELSISWPALLDQTCPMRLVVLGRILRTNGRKAVCSVDKHEFRTQARNLQVMPAARTDAMLQRWADTARKGGIPKAKIAGA